MRAYKCHYSRVIRAILIKVREAEISKNQMDENRLDARCIEIFWSLCNRIWEVE